MQKWLVKRQTAQNRKKRQNKFGRQWVKRMVTSVLAAVLILQQFPAGSFCSGEFMAKVFAAETESAEPAQPDAQQQTILIYTTEDFLSFVDNCTLDSWSRGKTVLLMNDISLEGVEFLPVPTFGGIFEGNNCTISGVSIDGVASPAGLFGILQGSAVVKNLTVTGEIAPTGKKTLVGGIAGQNYGTIWNCRFEGTVAGGTKIGGIAGRNEESGMIKYCQFEGTVAGETMTGGIVGENLGTVASCENFGSINTEARNGVTPNDTGGIAGYSSGQILSSRNEGTVGYSHLGYNVGGIAGRSCGFITNCENNGEIFGRKDVAGIAGQLEPDRMEGISTDWIAIFREEVNVLSDLIETAVTDAEGTSDTLSGELSEMNGQVGEVTTNLETLSGDLTGYGDALVAEVNRLNGVLSDVLARLQVISGQGLQISEDLNEAMNQLEQGFLELEKTFDMIEAFDIDTDSVLDDVYDALDDMEYATADMSSAFNSISSGMKKLEEAITIKDRTAADTALEDIKTGTKKLSRALGKIETVMGDLETAIREVEEELKQMEEELGGQTEPLEAELPETELPETESLATEAADDSDIADQLETLEDLEETLQELQNMRTYLQRLLDAASGLSEPLQQITDATGEAADALQTILDAVLVLQDNVDVDVDKIQSGLSQIRKGVGRFSDAMDSLNDSLEHMEKAVKDADKAANQAKQDLKNISAQMSRALDCFIAAGSYMQAAGEQSKLLLKEADALVGYLNNTEGISVASPGETFTATLDKLFDSVEALRTRADGMNSALHEDSGVLADDLRAINDQVNLLFNTLFDAIEETEQSSEEDWLTDTSEVNMDTVTKGKLSLCTNYGTVYGDTCVGGVVGSMAIENELDPEDDMAELAEASLNTRYEQKAVILNATNKGKVTAKKDYAGGICGRMDVGIVYESENYGSVVSESGDYVGGIAGCSTATIKNSFVKAFLSGTDYVGGILGAGLLEDATGTDSKVSGCYSMVVITEYVQYAGAIAGTEGGVFEENYYVSENLAGINRISLAGKAEPMSYESLLAVSGLPTEFRQFVLRFVAEEEEIQSRVFSYGDSFGADIFPVIPGKSGHSAEWDTLVLETLTFDTTVTAVYTPFRTAIAGAETREGNRSLFLVEGAFETEAELVAEAQPVVQEGFIMLAHDIEETVLTYLKFLETGAKPEESVNRAVEEQWKLSIPEDGAATHVIRYLPEHGETENLDIYIKTAEGWKKTAAEVMGSYLLFEAAGNEVEFLVLSTMPVWWVWALVGVVAVLLLTLLALALRGLVRLVKKGAKKRPSEKK